MDSFLSGPAVPSEIFSQKAVIVACSYVLAFQDPLFQVKYSVSVNMYVLFSRPCLPSEIFCLKAVIIACSYVLVFQDPLFYVIYSV